MPKTTHAPLSYDPQKFPRELRRHYIGASESDIQEMLASLRLKKLEDLYSHVPSDLRLPAAGAPIPEEFGYEDLLNHIDGLSRKNQTRTSFLGDGLPHYKTPEVVPHILGIRNLTTAYTPYQPERSQGTVSYTHLTLPTKA